MSVWRQKAIELFPDLQQELEASDATPYTVFFELLPRCRKAHDANDVSELERIYGYADWCSRQNAKDLWNSAAVCFYEHIIECRDARSQFHRWVQPDIFRNIASLIEAQMGQQKFEEFQKEYEDRRKRFLRSTRSG